MHKDIHHIIRVILLLSEKAKHLNKNWVERERAVVLDYEHPVQLYCLSVNPRVTCTVDGEGKGHLSFVKQT